MKKVIFLVAEVDVKTDSIIESTLRCFSSRNKQIEYLNELKQNFKQVSGFRCIFTKALSIY